MGATAIAIVDEDPGRSARRTEVLQRGGYAARPFLRAEDALRSLWDEPVDLLLVDLGLSGISARHLSRELRRRPWGRGLPVLGMGVPPASEPRPSAVDFSRVLAEDLHPSDLLRAIFDALLEPSAALGLMAADLSLPQEELSHHASLPARTGPPRLEVRILGAREYAAEYTLHLSRERLFVRTFAPLPAGEKVEVALHLPFAPAAVELTGRVELSVGVDSAESRLEGPGMRLLLHGVTPELQARMATYMAGLRAGASQQMPGPQTLVLFVGREDRLPAGAPSFLRRSGIRAVRSEHVAQALAVIARRVPDAVVVDVASLGEPPQGPIGSLRRAGVGTIVALAPPSMFAQLPSEVVRIDVLQPPSALLEQISEQLAVARRASARVRCPTKVLAERPDDAPFGGQVENVSLGGVLMRLSEPFAPGERLRLEFELPEQSGTVRATAQAVRVTRANPSDAALRVAAAFERLEGDSAHCLQAFVRRHSRPGQVAG